VTAKAATSSAKVVDSPMMELCDMNVTNTADAVTCVLGSFDGLGSCVRRRLERFVHKE
jgi:hypothetical protein